MQQTMKMPVLKLKQEVPTRWNSTLTMLQRLNEIKIPLSAVLSTLRSLPENLISTEWDEVTDCIAILRPVEQLTETLSGETYPIMSFAIPLIRNVQACLTKKSSKTPLGKDIKKVTTGSN